jgi:hypothetical protein
MVPLDVVAPDFIVQMPTYRSEQLKSGTNRPSLVCMLAEGTYFHGAATLCNSLVRQGFTGLVLLGYRGTPPQWARDLPIQEDGTQCVAPGAFIRLIELEPGWHPTNLKARFMRRAAQEYPDFEALYYFDVDIVITCAWDNYVRWAHSGVVLVLDMSETYMPANHVFRREWAALAQRAGYAVVRPMTGYFNGGCVGIDAARIEILDVWCRLLDEREKEGADMTKLVATDGKLEFSRMDQDILNAAVMASSVDVAVLGKEAMGSFPSMPIMAHAMVFKKPWRRNYLIDALKGFPPDGPDLAFWTYAQYPIASFSPASLRMKRITLTLAKWFGKVRRRAVMDW